MSDLRIENFIESKYREFFNGVQINNEYAALYEQIKQPKLRTILTTAHHEIVSLLELMNTRLPTYEESSHYWADPSRDLLKVISIIDSLHTNLQGSVHAFKIDDYYDNLFEQLVYWLKPSGGSEIPPHMKKIEIYLLLPIFFPADTIAVPNTDGVDYKLLKLIGEGSYAQVFKYKDFFYNRYFVLKRAKKELEPKELERFKKEFDIMKSLNSPYVTEVYRFFEDRNEYLMEYMDCTLQYYIEKRNTTISEAERKGLVYQTFRAFRYLHSKQILHRDISPNNILIKVYDDVAVVKICDFGLIKLPDSTLTTVNTEFKGCFNDPALVREGFQNYDIKHEIYALTLITFFIMTGRINCEHIANEELKRFVLKGTNPDKTQRFSSVDDLAESFSQIKF